jgi:sugar phosphate isomerase/epimerase
MKLSCLPVSFFADILAQRMSVADWARMGKQIGLDAIDLSVLFVPDRSLRAAAVLRRQIESEGMSVAMLTSYPDFTHPDPAQRSKELVLAEETTAIAAELGAKMLRVTAGQAHPETKREAGIAWAVEGLSSLVRLTRSSGVTLVYENHAKPGVWTYTDFSQPPELFIAIYQATHEEGLGINFDTGNASAFSDDPLGLLTQVLPRLVSIHASDTALKGELRHVLLGTGVTPYAQLFGCLKQNGWDSWICMEEASNQGKTGVESAASFIRKTWAAAQ